VADHVRNGGDVVVETLTVLGVSHVFGIPGQHALGLFDAIRRSALRFVSSRVENNSAFEADGYSRATGEVGVLFLSTGPGALTALGALQEAYATGVPLLVITSQVPRSWLAFRNGARNLKSRYFFSDGAKTAPFGTKIVPFGAGSGWVPGGGSFCRSNTVFPSASVTITLARANAALASVFCPVGDTIESGRFSPLSAKFPITLTMASALNVLRSICCLNREFGEPVANV